MTSQKFRGVTPHKDGGFIAKIGHQGKQVCELKVVKLYNPSAQARVEVWPL